MRTETINIYKFDELNKKAQEKAIENYRENYDINNILDEELNSIKSIAYAIGVTYELNNYYGYEINLDFYYGNKTDDEMNLSGRRAIAYIYNNYISPNLKGKYYSTTGKYIDNKYKYKYTYSKCTKVFCCPFTGLYMDDDLYITFEKFCNKLKNNKQLKVSDFIEMLADILLSDYNSQVNWLLSDENIIEEININNIEFLEDGTVA